MHTAALIDRLARFPNALRASCSVVREDDGGWSPGPEHWSIVQIVQHLVDEERDDFRPRVRLTLEDPSRAWPPIDPEGRARERGNHSERLPDLLGEFDRERADSVAWLRTLVDPTWDNAHHHPEFPPLAAGDVLASWAAHDAIHLRQVAKRLHQLATRDAGRFATDYAGPWRA